MTGAYWYEKPDVATRHPAGPVMAIDEYFDDFSTILMDVNGDGLNDLIVGQAHAYGLHWWEQKRGADPGEYDPVGIYYFKWNGDSFSKQIIDYGPAGIGKGCGIHFAVADLSGHGRLDVVAPGKDGLYFYENLGA